MSGGYYVKKFGMENMLAKWGVGEILIKWDVNELLFRKWSDVERKHVG